MADVVNQLSGEEEITLLRYISEIVSLSNADNLLDYIMEQTPNIMKVRGLSIYLVPDYKEFLPEYSGSLQTPDGSEIDASEINRDFIVLARTSRVGKQKLQGKAYYEAGSGLTGYAFEKNLILSIDDVRDPNELLKIDPSLTWVDRYEGSKYYYREEEAIPILIIPLSAEEKCIGVLKLPATKNGKPITQTGKILAVLISRVISDTIARNHLRTIQDRIIFNLTEMAATVELKDVWNKVTENLADMYKGRCQLYLRDMSKNHECIRLVSENGKIVDKSYDYSPGEGLIGWIYKTGKPLLINDMHQYKSQIYLNDSLLSLISDDKDISKDDRWLQCIHGKTISHSTSPLPFIGVPIETRNGEIQGVLCIHNLTGNRIIQHNAFAHSDMQRLKTFSNIISLAIKHDYTRCLKELLQKISNMADVDKMYDFVVREIPLLMDVSFCSILLLKKDINGTDLLLRTSNKGKFNLSYKIGEGKTGLCAQTKSTIVVNHFGDRMIQQTRLDKEFEQRRFFKPYSLISGIYNDKPGKDRIGLMELILENPANDDLKKVFDALKAQTYFIQEGEMRGITSVKGEILKRIYSTLPWSYIAVPIKSISKPSISEEVFGVITIGRSIESIPFNDDDIGLLEMIASRLSIIMHNRRMQEDRISLLLTLAHEINTPLQGIIADTKNLIKEIKKFQHLQIIAEHTLGQVNYLHMLTETIFAVISGQETPNRDFSPVNINTLLLEASEMFESEAKHKGCVIQPPKHLNGEPFPEIEMSHFDMLIAFRNLIHNAVKYSYFTPSRRPDKKRYIYINCWHPDNAHYSISIQNYGVGIFQEEIDSGFIFEPYKRSLKSADRRRTGAGLGLAQVRKVIYDLHHGTIRVSSVPKEGGAHVTTFIVTLPLKHEK